MPKSQDITPHIGKVSPDQRSAATGNRPCIVWLTGLSGCGKSTIAAELERQLISTGHPAYVLDGDNLRFGLNKDLGFGPEDRAENIRRAGEVANLLADAGVIVIASFISPYRADRDRVRALVKSGEFVEVFVDAPLEVCQQRDPKGLYKKARAALAEGKPMQFTGVDAPYEAPEDPEIRLQTLEAPPDALAEQVVDALRERGIIG